METDSPPPLDLSLKQQSSRFPNGDSVSHAESLNMLADMQRRFLDSTANLMPTNYTDKLQRVATGPSLPPAISGTPSEPSEAGTASAAAVAVAAAASLREAMRTANPVPGAGYENLYQMWMKQYVENYELYHCLQALCSYPVPPQLLLPPPPPPPVGSLLPQGPNGDTGGTISPCPPPPALPDLSSFLPKELAAVVNARPPICSPEHLGLSLRGNQKYSAFYQQHHGSARLAAAAAAVERSVPAPAPQPAKKVPSENFLKTKMLALGAGGSLMPDKTSPKETASTITKAGSSPSGLPEKSGLETGFDCSCSKSFENLYNFTVHLKETNHQPRSVHNERDIPKLVRGQDMWINSETEQTREILRCMRCQQSFRTLPDLTMHMMETGHYSEIVYNDSGRCVYVNSSFGRDDKKTAGGPRKEDLKRKESYSARDPVPVHKKMIKLEDIPPPPQPPSLVSAPPVVVPSLPPAPAPVTPQPPPPPPSQLAENCHGAENGRGVEKIEVTEEEEEPPRPISQPQQSTDEEDEEGEKGLSPSAQVTEPDSATEPSLATSVLQQIETFVERNLPKDPVKKKPSIGLMSCEKTPTETSAPVCVSSTPAPPDGPPYLAPDNPGGGPDENPLSSLQKLVETTEKTSGKSERSDEARRAEGDGEAEGVESSEGDSTVAVSSNGLASLSNLVAPSPTVIMVNPTYIYQPAFPPPPPPPSLFSPPTYPWYSAFPLVPHINNGSGSNSSSPSRTLCEPPTTSSIATSSPSAPIDAIDLSSQHPAALMAKSSPGTINATSMALAAAAAAIANNKEAMGEDGDKANVNGGSNVVQKKAKCNYCGKPFANKGQVRLHVSKGKCPSLAASPRCKSSNSLFSPTLRLPLDSHNSSEVEEKLKVYYNLAKQLSKENSE